MKLENPHSGIMWNSIKEIMRFEKEEDISFNGKCDGFYSITPLSIRWKNFFLNNLFWAYAKENQKHMICLSNKISEIREMVSNLNHIDIEEYLNKIKKLNNFSIYFTDFSENKRKLQEQLDGKKEDYLIVTQSRKNQVEEYITTIATKLFFIKKGYLVGEFEIPAHGSPDVVGIKGAFVNDLKNKGIIPTGGDESDLLIWQFLNRNSDQSEAQEETETIVCEIKSSGAWPQAYKQLSQEHKGYLKSHCFNKGYACFATTSNDADKQSYYGRLKYEAGCLIFVSDKEPVFKEDPICGNPSSSRKNESLSVWESKQKELVEYADKKITRTMISNIKAAELLKNMNDKKINEFYKKIDELTVKDVLDLI